VPVAYSLVANAIRVWPTPSTNQGSQNTLSCQYMQRASEVVATTAVATLSGALSSVTATTYRVKITGTAPATFTVGAVVEIVSGRPNYSTYNPTATITGSGSGYVDVSGVAPVAPQTPRAGDYLCLYDQAPVLANVPLEFQECLLQWVALKMMEAKGDQAAMERMGKALSVSEGNLKEQLSQRNAGQRRYLSAWSGLAGAPVRGLLWPLGP
jgi:hypothetical protein